ncbi:hypothetical protein [Chachezhania antarctica]|nr:hypothetical protein [Chachezhania antarctica]|tara:strand:- start:12857 stop:12979 length:123 start_codon:yes stop_codon:yes gene_type:complete
MASLGTGNAVCPVPICHILLGIGLTLVFTTPRTAAGKRWR